MLHKISRCFFIVLAIAIVGCAKRGTITGGAKDTISPVLVSSVPKNFSTNFQGKVIKLNFDEYVKLKDIGKQLIVSPLMNTPPEVSPSTASKFITIKIKDTLKENTTYSFNFGQSILDNNEGNPYSQFKYVFSTGAYIDSLSVEGTIIDALELQTDNYVSVMLYEINESYNDSTIYKERPRYITNTLDSLNTFKIDNVKAGVYQMIALKEKTSNYKFDPKNDRIAFHPTLITIPSDEKPELKIFSEVVKFKSLKPAQVGDGKLVIGYEGRPENIKTVLKNGTQVLPTVVTRIAQKDSVNIWFKPVQADSLSLSVSKEDFVKEYIVKIKKQKKDSLQISSSPGVLKPREKFRLTSNTPIVKFDNSKITMVNKDSIAVPFTTSYNEFEMRLEFDFERKPEDKYKIRMFPGALTDIFERSNDTLDYSISTKSISEYGTVTLNLKNVKQFPVIVELTDDKGKVLASEYAENSPTVLFEGLEPNKFTLRVIYDENKNGVWDTGSFLEKRQPEKVIYFQKTMDVRSNWDVNQDFDLGG